jgi:sarcosine oxidase delta subunit
MMRYTCPACGAHHASPGALWEHRRGCRPWVRPAWIARATDPRATSHPRGRVAGGIPR